MILTENLTKKFGKVTAVNRLNMSVRQGTVFGMVGENGAGKTTTLSMLATLSTPTMGKAYINGYEVTKQSENVRRSIGFMPDSFGVYDDLTVEEYLQFYADCYGVTKSIVMHRCDDLLERVNLTDKRYSYVNALSRGMQQRLEIARCLMHDPPVLILDEPSSGLDPRSRIELRHVLNNLRDLGKTVLISSHHLHELAEVADEIGILRHGELAAVAAVQVMMEHSNAYRTLRLSGRGDVVAWERILRDDPHVLTVTPQLDGAEITYAGTLDQQAAFVRHLIEMGVKLTQFAEKPTDIETLFLRLTDGGGVTK